MRRVVTVRREVELLTPAAVREIASRTGLGPAKRLGQNFVIDQGTVRRIATLAQLRPDDVVLEVGPGFGSLHAGPARGRRRPRSSRSR